MTAISDRIAQAITATPWAITEDALQQIIAVASREGDLQAVAMRRAEKLPAASRAGIRGNIATLNLIGPVVRYANLFSDISGATSLQVFATDFQAALDDPTVKAILLNVDSPGGMAAGVAEMAAAIKAANKPVWAYIDELGASASYWLPSAASRVVASKTALIGSIGVVSSVRSAANPDVLEIVSSRAPKKRMDPTTEDGRGEIQRIVDNLESVFVADVAKYRGVAEDKVVSEFGQGGLVFAPDALAAGMVDAIGSYEETLAALARVTSGTRRVRSNNMTTENGGATDPVMYSQDQLNAAVSAARTDEAAKVQVAVTGERQRIAAVQKLSRPGFEPIVQKGVEDGTSAAEVALAIMTAAADRGITLEAIQRDSPKPAAHAAPNADDDKPKGKSWDAITGVKPQRM